MRTFRLPDLGEGLRDAEVVSWHAAVGDHVVADQPLVSVETAKAVIEIPSPWSGRILALYGAQGDVIEVGAPLVDIETEQTGSDEGTVVGRLPGAPTTARPEDTGLAVESEGSRLKASPAVRKRARELDLDLHGIVGSGPGGTVTMTDLASKAAASTAVGGFVPLKGVRRAMADVMVRRALGVIAASVTDEAIIDAWPVDADVTVRLVRSIAAGCRAAPSLNSWYDQHRMMINTMENVDLGIAMETEDGLFVPVLRNAANRSAAELRQALDVMKRDIVARAIPAEELRGATISLSNFGMLGGIHASLTVVSPQVAILGAGRIHKSVRVIDDRMAAVRILPLSLTFDHRVVTGAEAVRFLNAAIADLQGEASRPA